MIKDTASKGQYQFTTMCAVNGEKIKTEFEKLGYKVGYGIIKDKNIIKQYRNNRNTIEIFDSVNWYDIMIDFNHIINA